MGLCNNPKRHTGGFLELAVKRAGTPVVTAPGIAHIKCFDPVWRASNRQDDQHARCRISEHHIAWQRLSAGLVGKVDHDWRRCAPDDHPVKRVRLGGIDLHVGHEGRDMDEIACACGRREFSDAASSWCH
jgi:hypothetical protein